MRVSKSEEEVPKRACEREDKSLWSDRNLTNKDRSRRKQGSLEERKIAREKNKGGNQRD
jgi:hypothetical protein